MWPYGQYVKVYTPEVLVSDGARWTCLGGEMPKKQGLDPRGIQGTSFRGFAGCDAPVSTTPAHVLTVYAKTPPGGAETRRPSLLTD